MVPSLSKARWSSSHRAIIGGCMEGLGRAAAPELQPLSHFSGVLGSLSRQLLCTMTLEPWSWHHAPALGSANTRRQSPGPSPAPA